jgi:hypothetical protein
MASKADNGGLRGAPRSGEQSKTTRRGFLKRVAIAGAAASALGLLARRPFAGSKTGDRSIPPSIPGKNSIFQPRNDDRKQ